MVVFQEAPGPVVAANESVEVWLIVIVCDEPTVESSMIAFEHEAIHAETAEDVLIKREIRHPGA